MRALKITVASAATAVCLAPVASAQVQSQSLNQDLDKLAALSAPGAGGGDSRGYDASGVDLLRRIRFNEFPSNSGYGGDCWGYTSASGREYAIFGMQWAYGFVEVTDPNNPVILGAVTGAESIWRDVKVIGDYAYGTNEGGNGIQIFDLSQIDQGTVRHVGNKLHQGHVTTHNIAANPESGYLYLCGANIGNGGLVAVTTDDPEDPTIVGAWTNKYVHDAQVVTYTDGPYAGREIAFCFTGGSRDLSIVDVTDKANMFTVSTISWPGARYGHQGWLSADRTHMYVNDEGDETNGNHETRTRIFNVADLNNPQYLGYGTSGLGSIDHNLYWHENRVYAANYTSGLQIFDVSVPDQMERVAWFDTWQQDNSKDFRGAWSCYPYFESGTVLISDMTQGLFLVRLNLPCPGDFNDDGDVNTLDVIAFLNAWSVGDASADINNDGTVNTLDVTAFLNAWNETCE